MDITTKPDNTTAAPVLNSYEQKQADRRARYEARALRVSAESESTLDHARNMASIIPMGQPILIGHHSEGRDRRYRARIHDTFGKGFSLMKKAEHYKRKAAAVGNAGVSSDDPDAIRKLQAQLGAALESQELMKKGNKILRTNAPENRHAALVAAGFSEAIATALLTPNCWSGIGFEHYKLSNNSANIRRLRQRIAALEKLEADRKAAQEGEAEPAEIVTEKYTYREDLEDNRLQFIFDGKPDEETRKILKSNGFKWSPRRTAWVRQITNNARFSARWIMRELDKLAANRAAA